MKHGIQSNIMKETLNTTGLLIDCYSPFENLLCSDFQAHFHSIICKYANTSC